LRSLLFQCLALKSHVHRWPTLKSPLCLVSGVDISTISVSSGEISNKINGLRLNLHFCSVSRVDISIILLSSVEIFHTSMANAQISTFVQSPELRSLPFQCPASRSPKHQYIHFCSVSRVRSLLFSLSSVGISYYINGMRLNLHFCPVSSVDISTVSVSSIEISHTSMANAQISTLFSVQI